MVKIILINTIKAFCVIAFITIMCFGPIFVGDYCDVAVPVILAVAIINACICVGVLTYVTDYTNLL